MSPAVDATDRTLVRLGARMRALAWNSRVSHAHHMERMAELRGEDGRAHAAWKEICEMMLRHWEGVCREA